MPIREATFWVGLTVFGTGLFFWIEGEASRMFWAIALTIIGGVGVAYSVWIHHHPTAKKLPMWVFLLLITWLAIGYDFYDRHYAFGYNPARAWDDSKPLQRMYPRAFKNETVVLDGKHFINPSFDNVTFFYSGIGPVQVDNPTFIHHEGGKLRVESNNKIVTTAILIEAAVLGAAGCKTTAVNMGKVDPNLPPTTK